MNADCLKMCRSSFGEFGRTPRINGSNSRDHWPQANTAVLAGGGMRTGQVIGATNRYGEAPQVRPVAFQEAVRHSLSLCRHRCSEHPHL
ncbi:MAG UNVERIFIED_CONTAM: DUF1501 domain-containing protein [Planctomycetaceae bacterium]|jgi:hypothetical protein